MDPTNNNLKSLIQKILAAFILVSIAITVALGIARFSFSSLMGTVDDLSQPNKKMTILNRLFEEIITLDQVQRAEAILNPQKISAGFLDQSVTINTLIDSLKQLPWDSTRSARLDEMKEILNKRNELFLSYLKVKAKLLDNRSFSVQLDTLGAILQTKDLVIDTSFMTAQKTVTTTVIADSATKKEASRPFFKRLFGKKPKKETLDTPKVKIEEQLSVVVDSQAISRQNKAIKGITKIMNEMESDQRLQRKKLQQEELDLINANSLFINQLLGILHTVEGEELAEMRSKNTAAVSVMNRSLSRINWLMLGSFIAAALLIYLIWIDVSRSNYYKKQLEQARDEAQELSQIKQRFLANMSHEIRTPLQSIIGFAEQLKEKPNAGKQEEVDAIYSSSEHLLHIVNEVLDYSRISAGTFIVGREPFKILTIIKEVESAMRIQAERKQLTFLLDTEKCTNHLVVGDAFRLRQILYNVLGNAIKFTNTGFVKLAARTTEENNFVRCDFEIIDTGIGMEEDELKKVFNQFEQANSAITKKFGGTGLGLTIVKTLVDAMSGNIDVSSEFGKGSSFRISLPFERSKAAVSINKNIAVSPVDIITPAGKVMIVDDDTLILRLCSLILKKNNVNFVTYSNARDVNLNSPDPEITHIFLDIRMPEINGKELCARLREIYPRETRITALTAHVLPEERDALLSIGFDKVLSKPFHEKNLLENIGIQSIEKKTEEEAPNLSRLRDLTLGDESLFQSVITQMIDETMDDVEHLRESFDANNSSAAREVVHKMSGRFSQVGIANLGKKLKLVETQLVSRVPLSDITPDIHSLIEEVNRMVIKIKLMSLEESN